MQFMEKMEADLPECLFDAGLFIGALLDDDPRHLEAFPLVTDAVAGKIHVCTTSSVLSEVYAALTWHLAQPPHTPQEAAKIMSALIKLPSAIRILPDSPETSLKMLELAAAHNLTARRIHDARHAAAAIVAGVSEVYTYDVEDWKAFQSDGLAVVGPASSLQRLNAIIP